MKEFAMEMSDILYDHEQALAEERVAREEAFYEHTIMSIVDLMLTYGYNNVLSSISRKYDEAARAMGLEGDQ